MPSAKEPSAKEPSVKEPTPETVKEPSKKAGNLEDVVGRYGDGKVLDAVRKYYDYKA